MTSFFTVIGENGWDLYFVYQFLEVPYELLAAKLGYIGNKLEEGQTAGGQNLY